MYKIAAVLRLSHFSNVRGAGNHMIRVIRDFAISGCDTTVFCNKEEYMLSQRDLSPCKIEFLTSEELKNPDKQFFKERNIDVVITDTGDEYANIRLIHGHSPMYRDKFVRTKKEKYIKSIFNRKRMLKKADIENIISEMSVYDVIIANSKIAAQDYKTFYKFPEERIKILRPRVEITKSFEYKPQKVFTFGMSAVTFDLKGGFIFLKTLSFLKKDKINFKARIIYPNHKKNLILNAALLFYGLKNNVEMLDFQKDMDAFYDSIDCMVVPSKEETYGLVIPEAMSNGKFCIISSRCGGKDIIKDGYNGFIFDFEENREKNMYEQLKLVVLNKNNIEPVSLNAYNTVREYGIEDAKKSIQSILGALNEEINLPAPVIRGVSHIYGNDCKTGNLVAR